MLGNSRLGWHGSDTRWALAQHNLLARSYSLTMCRPNLLDVAALLPDVNRDRALCAR